MRKRGSIYTNRITNRLGGRNNKTGSTAHVINFMHLLLFKTVVERPLI